MQVMRVYFEEGGRVHYLELPDREDVWAAVAAYDDENGTDFYDRLDERNVLGVNLGEYPQADRVSTWADVVGSMEVTCTKRVTAVGTSLAVIITPELRMLGLDRGDLVELTIRRKD